MKKVLVPLAEGFEEVEAVTIIDLLRRADIQVQTAHVTPQNPVRGAHGVSVEAETSISTVKDSKFDAIALPGGSPGTSNLAESAELATLLTQHSKSGALISAICAAPSVLAKHGLLQDRRATCYPGVEKAMTGARLSTEAVVEDGNFITSRGPGTALAFSLRLIERIAGKVKADEVRKATLA